MLWISEIIRILQSAKITWWLPPWLVQAPDGSLRLVDSATVRNDQTSNRIEFINCVNFSLAEQVFQQTIPYWVYKNAVRTKLSIQAGKSVKLIFKPWSTSANNDAVFTLYDDFDFQDTSKWIFQNSSISWSVLRVNGWNNVYWPKSVLSIPDGAIIEWNMYSWNYDFDSGFKVWNIYFISDRWSWTQAISTGITYPSWSQQGNARNEYQVILKSWHIKFTNKTVNKTVTSSLSYSTWPLQWFCDSDTSANPLRVDYVCVRKYYDESQLSINVISNADGSYTVEITNNWTTNINNTEIRIDWIPVNNYDVTVETSTPILTTKAMPSWQDSSVHFFTQFTHDIKYGSKCAFHIHSYIPPDAPTWDIKLKFKRMVIPVEIITDWVASFSVWSSNKELKEEVRVFTITEDMKGRHVLLNFGRIDTVNSLSQVVFWEIKRLWSDAEDTWNADLPVLYLDRHTEIDSIWSQDEFMK